MEYLFLREMRDFFPTQSGIALSITSDFPKYGRCPEALCVAGTGLLYYVIVLTIFMETKSLSAGKIVLFVLLGLLIILVLWGMSAYNSLVRLDENAKTAQSDIEVQYQRRFDLIPNLVNVVEGISQQEREVFGKLAEARSRYAGSPEGSSERLAAIGQLETSLSRLLVIVENYPQLKSSENFLRLQDQLEGTENRVSVARNNFNAAVNQLNQKIKFFPSNLVAGIFGFEARERFEAVEAAAEAPKVEIDFQ